MAMKPNRPVRVGTKMLKTDKDGKIPGERKPATRKPRAKTVKKPVASKPAA